MKAESKSSSAPQEPHQYLNLDVTPQKCGKDTFPASNENFHEMASTEELVGRNIPFSYPRKKPGEQEAFCKARHGEVMLHTKYAEMEEQEHYTKHC